MRPLRDSFNFSIVAWLFLMAAVVVNSLSAQPVGTVSSAPVYVPDTSHSNEPLPPGVLNWDATQKSVDATNGQEFAHFIFYLTNGATSAKITFLTNYTYVTNYVIVTNTGFWNIASGNKYSSVPVLKTNISLTNITNGITPSPLTIIDVHPSCGCTTAELPQRPWLLPPGTNTSIRVNVNLAGKSGTVFKTVAVTTDRGRMDLMLKITIAPAPPPRPMTAEERAAGVAAATIDRQAVFKGDCVSCHAKNVTGKYGQELYALVCSVCHDANPRATMVPDLHNLKDPTNDAFWRAWITAGKPGSLMPAFATSQGGPLDDFQIASLAAYLNAVIPSKVPQTVNK